jgi:hypothetical protein
MCSWRATFAVGSRNVWWQCAPATMTLPLFFSPQAQNYSARRHYSNRLNELMRLIRSIGRIRVPTGRVRQPKALTDRRPLGRIVAAPEGLYDGDIKAKCANRQTTHRSIRQGSCVMDDLLQYIDADYYRSAQLLIARADIVQLRRQSSALVRTESSYKLSTGACPPADDLDQTAPAVAARTV